MPCRDEGAEWDGHRETVSRLNDVTRMLCGVMTFLNAHNLHGIQDKMLAEVPGLGHWWAAHVRADAARAKREADARERDVARLRQEIQERQKEISRLTGKLLSPEK